MFLSKGFWPAPLRIPIKLLRVFATPSVDGQVDDILCRIIVKHGDAIWSFDESECILNEYREDTIK